MVKNNSVKTTWFKWFKYIDSNEDNDGDETIISDSILLLKQNVSSLYI